MASWIFGVGLAASAAAFANVGDDSSRSTRCRGQLSRRHRARERGNLLFVLERDERFVTVRDTFAHARKEPWVIDLGTPTPE